jgi:hypothetical protein
MGIRRLFPKVSEAQRVIDAAKAQQERVAREKAREAEHNRRKGGKS